MPARVLSVTELNGFIQRLFESNSYLKRVSVEGEISNLTQASSGHIYFSLKDRTSEIRCILWRSSAAKLKFALKNGLSIQVSGAVQVYMQRGSYSIIVSRVEPVGVGTLYQIYTQRLQDLEEKGYFNSEIKKPLPEKIKTVGVVTSDTGAVIHDIITTVKRLDPTLEILLVPAIVQGEGASESIAEGIERLNNIDKIDVIIVGRGGGSIEDLWAFNEMEVAEAIHKSKKPIISSVGHETDVTISDMVADMRAATPTAAAEYVSGGFSQRVTLLNNLEDRLLSAITEKYNNRANTLNRLEMRVRHNSPENKLMGFQFKIDELDLKIYNSIEKKINELSTRLEQLKIKTELLNPTFILKRGFVMVTNPEDKLIKSVTEARENKDLILHFYDGVQPVEVVSNE